MLVINDNVQSETISGQSGLCLKEISASTIQFGNPGFIKPHVEIDVDEAK